MADRRAQVKLVAALNRRLPWRRTLPGMDATDATRADLTRRIAAIDWRAGPARLAVEVGAIRAEARRHGFLPAVTVSQALEAALARGERGALVHGWLALLREAVASARQDRAASDTFAAACAVRFAA